MINQLKTKALENKKKLIILTFLAVAVSIVSIPAVCALSASLLTQNSVGGDYVVGVPLEESKFVELGAAVADSEADISKSAMSFSTLIGTPKVIQAGNTGAKDKYSVSIQIATSSGESGATKIGEATSEVIVGTLTKAKGETEYTFTYTNPNAVPSFVGTYASNELDATDTNLWSYIRITNVQMKYYTDDGAEINVMNRNYPSVQAKLTDLTNTIIGGTFCANDSSGSYQMKQKVPKSLAFGVFYPKTLNFQGLNSNLLWGIEVFGFKCPKQIVVNAYRANGLSNTLVSDNIIYDRSDTPILLIIYRYVKSTSSADEVVTDVMNSLDTSASYKYQLKFDYKTATDPIRYSSVKDITSDSKDNRILIFFSKAQFKTAALQ